MAHLTTDPSAQQRWIVLYPSYINSRKTKEEGRKIPNASCVDNPKISEMKDVLTYHEFNCVTEVTQYSFVKVTYRLIQIFCPPQGESPG